jgi:hypothetical protein
VAVGVLSLSVLVLLSYKTPHLLRVAEVQFVSSTSEYRCTSQESMDVAKHVKQGGATYLVMSCTLYPANRLCLAAVNGCPEETWLREVRNHDPTPEGKLFVNIGVNKGFNIVK